MHKKFGLILIIVGVSLLGTARISCAAPSALNKSCFQKKAPAKANGQLAEDLTDESIRQRGSGHHQRLNIFLVSFKEADDIYHLGIIPAVAVNTVQNSHIYQLLYYRFILYPFHAFG